MNKRQLKKLRKNADKNLFRTEMHIALGGISGYKARLHKLALSGNYSYGKIEEVLGKFIEYVKSQEESKDSCFLFKTEQLIKQFKKQPGGFTIMAQAMCLGASYRRM